MRRSILLYCVGLLVAISAPLMGARNTLVPNGKLFFNFPSMGDQNAFSLMGEFGGKIVRGNGTYGVYFNPKHRIKFSGDLLIEKLAYHFTDGLTHKWMTQYAVGGEYQYLLLHDLVKSIDFAASFSHSFSRGASSLTTPARISSSDGVESYLGSTINIWDGGYFSYALNYDFVRYLRKYQKNRVANGFGGTIKMVQYLPLDFSLEGEADFRRPFYYYSGIVNWHRDFESCGLDCGAYVNYTYGQQHLPNTLVAGIQLGLSLGSSKPACRRPQNDANREIPWDERSETRAFCSLPEYISKPAVCMPMVLSIADQHH